VKQDCSQGVLGGRMRHNRHNLKQDRFCQDVRKKISPLGQSEWTRLPREIVLSLLRRFSREVWIKPWVTWSNLVVYPALSGRVDWRPPWAPFWPELSYDSVSNFVLLSPVLSALRVLPLPHLPSYKQHTGFVSQTWWLTMSSATLPTRILTETLGVYF